MCTTNQGQPRNGRFLIRTTGLHRVPRTHHRIGHRHSYLLSVQCGQAGADIHSRWECTLSLDVHMDVIIRIKCLPEVVHWIFLGLCLHLHASVGRHICIRKLKVNMAHDFDPCIPTWSGWRLCTNQRYAPLFLNVDLLIPGPSHGTRSLCGYLHDHPRQVPRHRADTPI